MKREIILPADTWLALRSHLLGQGTQEQLVFLLTGVARGRGWLRLLVREVLPVPSEALERQSATSLVIKPAYSQSILRRCYEEGLSLIEVHSHPFSQRSVAFSATDLANEAEKFRYVARKIPHIHHATMVVGQVDLDAHLWDRRRRRALPVDRIRLLDTPIIDLIPTSSTNASKPSDHPAPWLDRQVLAFGVEGQQRLQNIQVGVVGCGGTGSVAVQMLAHLGVNYLVLVDPDVVEISNLNRLVGATRTDARRKRHKVHALRRFARQINPDAKVRALTLSVTDPKAVAALKGVDLLFGCTDNHGSRLILNQLSVQYLLPYLDLGAGLQTAAEGQLASAGGQVRLVRPGDMCLACIDGIDRAQAGEDLLSSLGRERRQARGYVQGDDLPTPAVLFLNNTVASLAVAEFVNLWTGYRSSTPLLYFDLLASRLTAAAAERQSLCLACGEGGSLALGDLEPMPSIGRGEVSDTVPCIEQMEVNDGKTDSNQ